MNNDEKHILIAELVRNRLPGLVLFARQWDRNSAEDIVQDAFVKLFREKPFPRDPVAWLFTVVRNEANNYLRSLSRRKNREDEHSRRKPLFQEPDFQEEEELIRELEQLDSEYREIVVSKIWGGLSFEQIASLVSSSRSTVHRKYKEALEILHERLSVSCRNVK